MHPRPLYRWKSFWVGMLFLGFLGWAWASTLTDGFMYVPVKRSSKAFGSYGGIVRVDRSKTPLPFPAGKFPYQPPEDPGRLPKTFTYEGEGGAGTLTVAYGFS
jgi:hypothetical protein